MRPWLKWLGIGTGVLVALVIVTIVGFVIFIRSESGAGWIATTVEKGVSSPGLRLKIAGLGGALPFDMHAKRIQLLDQEGVWLEIDNAAFDLDPWALLRGTARIGNIAADRIQALRQPVAQPVETKKQQPVTSDSFSLPNLPVAVEVDRLAIGRIEIAEALAGQAITLTAGGHASLANGAGQAKLTVQRLDAAGDLTLNLSYGSPAEGGILDVGLRVREPSGVLLANLLPDKQSRPLTIDLAGKGPLADWHGRLDVAAGDDGKIGADLRFGRTAALTNLAMTGSAAIARLLPAAMRAPAGGEVTYDIAVSAEDAGPITLQRMKLVTAAASLEASGSYNTKSTVIAGSAKMAADMEPFADLAGSNTHGHAELTIVASGTAAQPKAKLALIGTGLAGAGASLDRVTFAIDASPGADGTDIASGTGQLEGLVANGLPPGTGLGDRIDITFDAVGTDGLKRVDLKHLAVTGAGLDLTANGLLADGGFKAHADLKASDLSKFRALAGMALGGGVTLTIDASSPDMTALEATLDGRFQGLKTGIPAAEAALGPDSTLKLAASRSDAGLLTLKTLKLAGADLTADGSGSYDPGNAIASGNVTAQIPQLAPIGKAMKSPMAGTLKLVASGSGDKVDLVLTGTGIQAGGAKLDTLDARVAVPDLKQKEASLTASLARGTLQAKLDLVAAQTAPDTIQLKTLKLTGPATSIDGTLIANTTTKSANGRIAAKIADLGAWAPIVGQKLTGSLNANVALAASPGARPVQNADVTLVAENLAAGAGKNAIRLKTAHIDAKLTDLMGKPGGHATVAIAGVTGPNLLIDTIHLDASSQKGGVFAFALDTKGTAATKQVALNAKGALTADGTAQMLTLAQMQARYGDLDARLEHALEVEHKGDAVKLQNLALAIANGHVAGNAAYDGKTVDASLKADGLAVGTFTKLAGRGDASGSLSLALDVNGPVTAPRGTASLKLAHFAFGPASGQQPIPIDLTANAALQPTSVALTSHIASSKNDVALDVAATVPVVFAAGGGVSVPTTGAISGHIKGGGRLEPLNDIAPIGEDRMGGAYAIDLSVSGTAGNPQAGGSLSVSDGSYVSEASGTVLKKLTVRVEGQGRQFTLAKFSATDGGSGTLDASGKVDLANVAGPSFDLQARLKSFTGASSDLMTAVLSGDAAVTGNLAAPHVTADLTIDKADVNIPSQLPASYAKLDVIRIDSRHPQPPAAAPPAPPTPIVATLDIKVHDANRTFVRGDGLDSEWKGDLAVAGTSAAPRVTGELQTISGTFSVLGKDFTIQRGVVDFVGSTTPTFDIQAQAQASDVTALVELQGTPDAPKLTLSSTPALPQDEVLSRVMFGSGTSQLTPVQGLQIAAAAASLAGGGGPGVLDRLRNYTGLDRLSLGSDNTNGSSQTQGSGSRLSGTSISGGQICGAGRLCRRGTGNRQLVDAARRSRSTSRRT